MRWTVDEQQEYPDMISIMFLEASKCLDYEKEEKQKRKILKAVESSYLQNSWKFKEMEGF